MSRLMLYSFLTAVVLILPLSTIVYSGTFSDTFNDPSFTNNNWVDYNTEVQQTWSFPLLSPANPGYHVSTTSSSPPAAKGANNGIEYYSTDLYIEALVRIDSHSSAYASENIAGLAFSMTQGTGYFAAFELDFEGHNETVLQIGIIEGDRIGEIPVSINFDTFYKLAVHVDVNQNMHAYLYTLEGTLLGNISATNVLSIDSGKVGIFGGLEVTFDDYTLTGTPVDQTSALSKTQISQLYVSIFGRASEGGGNTYWQSQSDMVTAANTMLDTQAAKDYFGANLNTNQAFIEHIYLNTLNKTIADDFGGISYWVNLLDTGTTRGEAVASLVGVIKEYAPGARYYNPDDIATVVAYNQFTNRVEVSDYMADNVWGIPDDWETSTSFSHGMVVTDDPATVITAKVSVNGFLDEPFFGTCGAYVAPGVWKEFDCYNLAAIGKTTNDDPFTPSWRLTGGYWQWGRKGPDPSLWYDTNTLHFAHGPTGPGLGDANSSEIIGWDPSDASDGSWSDSYKTANDPCPEGFRVPTETQWEGVIDNNTQNAVGSWDSDNTNYSSARLFGDKLLLSAAAYRISRGGSLYNRGSRGQYWSSSQYISDNAWYLGFFSGGADTYYSYRRGGFSVRCVVE